MANLRFSFPGQTVVVTGAARGIGYEVARFFRESGAVVYLVDHDEAALSEAAFSLGSTGIVADVSDTADVQRVVARVVDESGRLDVLVNNAGILRDAVVWKMSDEQWQSVVDIHLGGTFRFTRECVPHFRAQGRGRIISMTSYSGLRGNTGQVNYSSAKAGIIGFTKTAAKELARFGITVNAISPNAETRMIESVPPDKLAQLAAAIPMGRFAAASEMCAAVGFFASDEASYVTGTVLAVDGGVAI